MKFIYIEGMVCYVIFVTQTHATVVDVIEEDGMCRSHGEIEKKKLALSQPQAGVHSSLAE